MRQPGKYILIGIILLLVSGIYTLNADRSIFSMETPEFIPIEEEVHEMPSEQSPQDNRPSSPRDTLPPRYPVAKVIPDEYKDLDRKYPIDLRNPENFDSEFEYDPASNTYRVKSKIGDIDVTTPFSLTPDEYMEYSFKRSMDSYFRKKYDDSFAKQGKDSSVLSMFDFKFDLGPAEKLFGPGGVQLSAQGSVTVKMAMTRTTSGDPTRTANQRNRTAFDFDSQVQTNVAAKVGDKINFDLNYNTETTFDFDTKKLKLGYQGKEDEIIKVLEAGNVSMNTTNSLIRGGAALFGIKTELQFGKLTVDAIFSQQESQSKTVSSKGTSQTVPFEIKADAYDENRHFFLAQYHRDKYDNALATLPIINSGIKIQRIEVWITNKRSDYSEARNIVAFSDLGEHDSISNTQFISKSGTNPLPYNNTNSLYSTITRSDYSDLRDISKVSQAFQNTSMVAGRDYEKIESARKLSTSEYIVNYELGYISLAGMMLQPDEVLAVAYEYKYKGEVYQVGEFSIDKPDNTKDNLFLKLIKGTAMSPGAPFWDLMMKNVYSLNASSIQAEKFKLNIKYQNDTTGVYINYIPEGDIKNELLIRVLNLDRLDSKGNAYPDGYFDFQSGYTILPQSGKVIFPVVEPFGSYLRKKINSTGDPAKNAIADKYVFQELYDSTMTVAKQIAEKNKFVMEGEYKGSASSEINLGGNNIASGSVKVTANGVNLIENVDYTVDYTSGNVTVINPQYENANIQVSSENQSSFGMQRKTMMGLNLNYAINPNFNIGATVMNLSEMPVTMKVNLGEESINNTLYGFNTNYTGQSQWLTNLFDKLPLLNLTQVSTISFSGEFAHLIPGHYKSKEGGDYSYIDDFEKSKQSLDLRSPYSWNLSSTPAGGQFKEATDINKVSYGENRALLAWYYIDGLFTRTSSLTPAHIKTDEVQLSDPYVREVQQRELFPNKEDVYAEASTLPVFNLAYYPKERGPYNLDAVGVNSDGTLTNPQSRWGGITRKIESSFIDFEAANVEYIEFWLLDPFIKEPNSPGGDLYFNLGEVSEDVLKDGKKFFEHGLPINNTDPNAVDTTVWGKIPKNQSLVYAFDNTAGARATQDVGLNGLSKEEEKTFPAYANFLTNLMDRLDDETKAKMENDPFSPINSTSGDIYHYFRGSDYDNQQASILYRYKHYNGTEGNSADANSTGESYNTAAKLTPDVEDINQDNTLNETEKYYQYKVSIRPQDLVVGKNYITEKKEATVTVKDKNQSPQTVNWYQFKIPVKVDYENIGDIKDFRTIRFMRMFMTNFADSSILRFGTLELVKGDWRNYTQNLSNPNLPPSGNASVSLSTVNIEENSRKEPVNYVLPPGVSRILDPSQPQLRQQNEQALSVKIENLAPGDARAIYKNTGLDTRQYKRLQMFSHAEKLIDDVTNLQNDELSIFIRLGSDYKNNYYEYEVPLKLTSPGNYSGEISSDQEAVWPEANMFNFPFEILTDLKLERNKEKRKAGSTVTYGTPYSNMDPNYPLNKITVIGNPSISEIKVIMIGVRNNSRSTKSTEVWANELRLTEFNEDGGWAAKANLFVGLSDLGSINFSGKKETSGFGSLDQGIMDRNLDDLMQYNINTAVEIGKFFPEKAKVSIPFQYSYSEEVVSPKYNPLDQDILLKDALDAVDSKAEKDSIKSFSQQIVSTKNIGVNNMRVDIRSKNPMPYDPANFSLGYMFTENFKQDATTTYERDTRTQANFAYNYSPFAKPVEPFKSIKSKSGSVKLLKDFGFSYLPNELSITSDITRNYYEAQLRDLNNQGGNMIDPSFREDFYWNRAGNIQWNLTKNLNASFTTGTKARIDAPHVQVNKEFNKDEYAMWKDSVWKSIQDLGTPLNYDQAMNVSYNLPFKSIPMLDFITATVAYTGLYSWEKGATIEDPTYEIGNTIRNERTLGISNFSIGFTSLYNKSHFLNEVNKKFAMKRTSSQSSSTTKRASQANKKSAAGADSTKTSQKTPVKKPEKKKFEGEVQLNPDSVTVVQHQLDNKRVRVTARGENGRLYEVKFKALDKNSIRINNKDTSKLKLTVSQLTPLDETTWYKTAQVGARGLMMVRSARFSYNQTNSSAIPNFSPNIGDFFGQGSTPFGNAPGLDFAFGFTDESYVNTADSRGWLIKTSNYITPAIFNKVETFTFGASLEPFTGLRVDLTANRTSTSGTEIEFMNDGSPKQFYGSFNMTTIAIGSSFEKHDPANNYRSETFEKFQKNRQTIYNRLENAYNRTTYPNAGFISGKYYANKEFIPYIGDLTLNSTDVLIPAFIAAYTGKDASSVGLSAFPSLKQLLPNWKITYDGFIQLDFINKHFKSFQLSHEYNCRYVVGNYTSYASWVATPEDGGLGFIKSLTDSPIPSSPYEISAASLTEAFNPLIGLNATFKNNMSLKAELQSTRNVNLNVSSFQLVEASTSGVVVGVGYVLTQFNKVLKMKATGGENFSNDLKVSADFNFQKRNSLIRKIQDGFTQATGGESNIVIKLAADYSLSKALSLQAFYDRLVNKPLVSSTAYPTTKSSFGINIRLSLMR